ncbi:MAG: flavodoxin [Actinobacteria bacterium RBG_13_35_12]|nr:MAG: flavodoxin [Actinobacteria bacterium RBG_13_35_12]OFW62974.1 MAG: flavodoxin [Actinobacteria bacterium RBG_19FT_COMBO_36_27]OGD35670.1 MAG: flavodoxin [Candidatus Atribacteria bacterium RBG_16_35_8]
MNIGIILYSETGNTYSVSQKLKEKLVKAEHSVNIERLKVIGKVKPGTKDIKFETLPDNDSYDALVFGSPVQAFSLSSAMTVYLSQIKSLQDKKIAFLVTQFFPFAWLGGNRAIGQMKKICESKGAAVCGTAVVNWSKPNREKQITEVVEKLSKLF